MGKKRKDRKIKIRFGRMLVIIGAFLVMTAALLAVQKNVSYRVQARVMEPVDEGEFTPVTSGQEAECLILWENDANGQAGLELMEAVLGQMKIPYAVCEGKDVGTEDLNDYEKIVLSMTNWNLLGEGLLDILDWVDAGGGLMVMYPPAIDGYFQLAEQSLGITSLGNRLATVEGLHFTRPFMLGEDRDFAVTDPFESSLAVTLDGECTVYLESDSETPIPLIWSRDTGEGRVVVNNMGFLNKTYRGFYSSSYTLLGDVCAYPVINASTFYIDDFPAPVPSGNSQYIEEEYGLNIGDFYTQVWWNDVYNLAEEYDIRYTGMVIEEYSDEVEGPFERNTDVRRFRYFGNLLLRQGGEIGYHGYNHMPLCLVGFDYGGDYEAYNLWESVEDMKASLTELRGFCSELFPREEFQVYVPPSNILSDEGRQLISEEFPEIRAIASVYLPGGVSYSQEFQVAEDGIVETPRIISGYIMEPDIYMAAVSELNFHFVNTHFQHPDDVLDEDRGAELGWQEMYSRLSDYLEWLYGSAGSIRNLTGTELAGAVQVYDMLEVKRSWTEQGLKLDLEGFKDEAWLMLRFNDGTPEEVTGGTLEELLDGLYLLRADSPEVEIEMTQ